MPRSLSNPARGAWVVLKHDGPMNRSALEQRVSGVAPYLPRLLRLGTIEQEGELFRLGDGPEPGWDPIWTPEA